MNKLIQRAVTALTLAGLSAAAQAQWPERPITWVVPFAAGGPMDTVSRPIAKKMGELLGTAVVVENRPGAGGAIGMNHVSRAAPDGYTIGIGSVGTQTIVPNITQPAPYDPLTSFSNIGLLGRYTNVLLVPGGSALGSVPQLLSQARDPQANVTYGSAGEGSSNHLSGALLGALSGGAMTHVPYRGSAPALTDLLAGRTTFMFDTLNTTMGRIKDGSLRPLAVSGHQRSPFLPDVPTLDEAGVQGYGEAGGELWWGVVGPPAIPAATRDKLNAALRQALDSPDVQDQLQRQYVEIWSSTPQGFEDVVRASHDKWRGLVARSAKPATP